MNIRIRAEEMCCD